MKVFEVAIQSPCITCDSILVLRRKKEETLLRRTNMMTIDAVGMVRETVYVTINKPRHDCFGNRVVVAFEAMTGEVRGSVFNDDMSIRSPEPKRVDTGSAGPLALPSRQLYRDFDVFRELDLRVELIKPTQRMLACATSPSWIRASQLPEIAWNQSSFYGQSCLNQ